MKKRKHLRLIPSDFDSLDPESQAYVNQIVLNTDCMLTRALLRYGQEPMHSTYGHFDGQYFEFDMDQIDRCAISFSPLRS